jgi:hypothetical protein
MFFLESWSLCGKNKLNRKEDKDMPLHGDVHVDRPLSNFAVEYSNEEFIASQVCPFVPVVHKSDSYFSYTKKDRFTIPEDIRGPKGEANEVDWSSTTATYACVDHALRDFLPDAVVGNADPGVDPRRRTTTFLVDLLLLAFERRISVLTMTAGNYGASYKTTLSGTDQWSDLTNSDPMANAQTARNGCFKAPNMCFMGKEVWDKVSIHPQILDRVKGGANVDKAAMVRPALVAELFEVDTLLVGKAQYNTANKGQTASYSRVWGKHVVFAYTEPQPALDGVSAFKTFRYIQESTDVGYKVRTYRDEARGGGGEWIEPEFAYDEEAVCADVAYILVNAVA